MSIDLGTINSGSDFAAKTPNTFPLARSDFPGNLLDVLNIFSGFSFWYFKLQHQVIAWQQDVQGSIFTLLAAQMSCALGSDGQLKDASAIDWYNDPDDDTPMLPPPPPPASNGKLTAFVSRSGRAVKPTEKIRDAGNTTPAKRVAPAPPQGQPAPKRVQRGSRLVRHHDDDDDEPPALEDCSDDEEEAEDNDGEEAYERTKVFGDKDREDRKHKKKEERSGDLKVVFTQEKGRINPHTQEPEDGWWCEICSAFSKAVFRLAAPISLEMRSVTFQYTATAAKNELYGARLALSCETLCRGGRTHTSKRAPQEHGR
ncbi:hypothetical protein C8R48DRAFT_675632 [Suillus tomentosus]|nr:hypothetical protein C8R48DRAFT_675632 [Suillus tomentosus]